MLNNNSSSGYKSEDIWALYAVAGRAIQANIYQSFKAMAELQPVLSGPEIYTHTSGCAKNR